MVNYLNLLRIIPVLLFFIIGCKEDNKPIEKKNTSNNSLKSNSGKYLDYDYVYMDKDNRIVVTFPNKFLPRNDEIVVGAIKNLIFIAYNETIPDNSNPTLENRNGINFIKFNGKKSVYYVQLIKEDTGEVNSFTLWGEPE